jgi:hypothetical protein
VSASLNSLEFPTLVDIYLRFGFMDKGHGSNPKSFHSTITFLQPLSQKEEVAKVDRFTKDHVITLAVHLLVPKAFNMDRTRSYF